jgi:2-keto-4-pentenoate hydratase/2-oxohepta-3-ene-1,7-dioic acid hydratase in catechol pathway
MKLCMFSPKGVELERGWPGRLDGDRIVQLAAQTLQAFFTGGGGAREHAEYPLAECDLRAPVLLPPSIRVFRPFERGETPFFSFRSPFPVLGPEDALAHPDPAAELDYGLGLAAVIGADMEIGGFTLANDWSLRALARAEREAGFGPSKSGDFAFSLGPVLVTPDEFAPGGLVARVNGQERCGVDLRELVHRWEALRAHAARGTVLRPGEILVAAAPTAAGPPLEPGDLVELEAEGIGVLANQVAEGLR